MLSHESQQTILHLRERGVPIHSISRLLKLSRNTVKRVIRVKGQRWRRPSAYEDLFPIVRDAFAAAKGNALRTREMLESQGHLIPYSTLTRIVRSLHLREDRTNCAGCRWARKETAIAWLRKLMRGNIGLDELTREIGPQIPPEDVAKLYECVLRGSVRYRNRAISILSVAKGLPRHTVADYLLIGHMSIYRNFFKYETRGVATVVSDKGKRPLKQDDPAYMEKVFSILHSPPSSFGVNRTSWRQEDIKKVLADNGMPLSRHAIRNIIRKAGFSYRKARTVLTSNDPEYHAKLEGIKAILANLGPKEKFFSIDEYGPFAVKLQGGRSLVPAGTVKTVPRWQKSKGSLILTAALELSTNQVTHFYSKRKNTSEMIKLLDILLAKHADEDCIYLSWDAASWHASRELYKRVETINSDEHRAHAPSPLVRLAPLPTCAQFLNVIESVFSGMAKAIIHNSDYQSVEECQSAIDRYFHERNEHFKKHPKRAGNRIWGKERVEAAFKESNNCKDPMYCTD